VLFDYGYYEADSGVSFLDFVGFGYCLVNQFDILA
jgi:hypothetical protein